MSAVACGTKNGAGAVGCDGGICVAGSTGVSAAAANGLNMLTGGLGGPAAGSALNELKTGCG